MFHVKVGAFIHLASCCCFISPLFRVRDGPKSPNQVCVCVCVHVCACGVQEFNVSLTGICNPVRLWS